MLTVVFFSTWKYVQKSHIFITGLHVICIHRTDTGKVISAGHSVSAYLNLVTTWSSLVKFNISILPVQGIPDCLFYGVRCEVVASVLLKIQILWDVTCVILASSSWCFEGESLWAAGSQRSSSKCWCCGIILQKGWIFSIAFVQKKGRNCKTYWKNILIVFVSLHFSDC